MKPLVHIEGLRSQRNHQFTLSVDHLDLKSGTVLCITGPNGCGKTTLIECLAGILEPDHGTITIDGCTVDHNLRNTRSIVGFIPDDETWFVKELCAKEYFDLLTTIYKRAGVTSNMSDKVQKLAYALHFTTPRQPLGSLSHGNKKKVQLIAGLMHDPKVIILDEMRNGLDPLAIIAAEDIIKQEVKRGACVVAATHDLWWAERIANEVLLLADGKAIVHKKTLELIKRYGSLENLFIQTSRASRRAYETS